MEWTPRYDLVFVVLCIAISDGDLGSSKRARVLACLADIFPRARPQSLAQLIGAASIRLREQPDGRSLIQTFTESCRQIEGVLSAHPVRRSKVLHALVALSDPPLNSKQELMLRCAVGALGFEEDIVFRDEAIYIRTP